MTLSAKASQDVTTYGKVLDGSETELDLVKLNRIKYLKEKMRSMLASEIGDPLDNITDLLRTIVLGEAIRIGVVTDKAVVNPYNQYIASMLEGYGGPEAILNVLLKGVEPLGRYLVAGYYTAKTEILAAQDEDAVRSVDL